MRGAAPTTEPLYVQFEDEDTAHTWLALLRSYAMPEVYGRWLSPEDGGLYRMWRQVDLTVLQGRGLGATRPLPADDLGVGGGGGGACIGYRICTSTGTWGGVVRACGCGGACWCGCGWGG